MSHIGINARHEDHMLEVWHRLKARDVEAFRWSNHFVTLRDPEDLTSWVSFRRSTFQNTVAGDLRYTVTGEGVIVEDGDVIDGVDVPTTKGIFDCNEAELEDLRAIARALLLPTEHGGRYESVPAEVFALANKWRDTWSDHTLTSLND